VIVDKDPVAAEKALLQLPGLKRYRKGLRSKPEQEHFLRHLRKYIYMYMTDCPWEVSTTNRYTITTYEAAITARRRIKQGDTIKYLTGTLVPLTLEESTDLDSTHRDFSIVVSARKKNSSIFLGPARFANHDCDANGRLVTRGPDGMEVIAMKNIEVGDEITVSYGDDYFGPGNIDCLCHTCETLHRNGWSSEAAVSDSRDDGMTTPVPESDTDGLPRKRKHDSEAWSATLSPQPSAKKARVKPSPSKLQQSWTPASPSDSEIAREDPIVLEASEGSETRTALTSGDELALSPPHSPVHPEQTNQLDDSSAVHLTVPTSRLLSPERSSSESRPSLSSAKAKRGPKISKMTARLLGDVHIQDPLPISPAPTSPSNHDSTTECDGSAPNESLTSAADDTITVKIESVEASKMESDEPILGASQSHDAAEVGRVSVPPADHRDSTPAKALSHPRTTVSQTVSTLAATRVTKTAPVTEPANSMTSETMILPSIEPSGTTATLVNATMHPISDTVRVPGDYILTRKLLAQPHDRWVQCHNLKCLGYFIQPNGYQTRRECPRCERHSMLYGFPWPKTDPDPRKLLERKRDHPRRGRKAVSEKYSAYRREGKCGKGTWVEGGGDEEERVMDHRTIHRFVLPEEEKELTRKGLLRQAEEARSKGDDSLALLDGRRSRGAGTDSVVQDMSERGSATPDEARRRSNRFVTRPVGVYTDRF